MREPWLEDSLGYLIGAERTGDFFEKIYEREPLVVVHDDATRFDGLLSIDDVDRIVTGTDLRDGQLDLANAARRMNKSEFVDSAGYVDRGAVADLYRGGATIILQQAHQLDPRLGRLCRSLEYVFSSHVQTNLYLTPPNAQGFRTHYDNHDVLVIQVAGEKRWRLYGTPVDTPYRGEAFELGKYESGELKHEFVLKAGDCAYVPRGLMHDAVTSGASPSLHITVGLITRTWADLMLEAVSEAALRLPDLRRSLPPGYARPGFDRDRARAELRRMAELVAKEIQLDPALDLNIDTFIRSRAADNRGAILEAMKPIEADERFILARRAPFRVAPDGDKIVVIAPGGEIELTEAARPALERALGGGVFAPQELGDDGVAITAKLLAYGLVWRA